MTPAPPLPESPTLSHRATLARALAETLRGTSDAQQRIDAIVDSARTAFDTPAAQLSIMTDRQVTASVSAPTMPQLCVGTETPYDDTVCATALRVDGPVQVDDAATDSRVSSIPAVTDGILGSYLGMPVRVADSLVGVLCVYGDEPRSWTDADRSTLDGLAREIERELSRLDAAADRTDVG